MHELTACRDGVDRDDRHARRTEFPSGPAEAALKQIPADAHTVIVTDGKEEVLLAQHREDLGAPHSGFNRMISGNPSGMR
jgi:hypothetical protein